LNIQEWLLQARIIDARVRELETAREGAKRLLGLNSVPLYPERVQVSKENRTENHLVRYLALDEELRAQTGRLLALKRDILAAIDRVSDPLLCTILTAYYINAKTLEVIAEELNYSVRQISRLHQKAVAAVEAAQ